MRVFFVEHRELVVDFTGHRRRLDDIRSGTT